jgi:uncharacterized protein YacL (UPF0231 family)
MKTYNILHIVGAIAFTMLATMAVMGSWMIQVNNKQLAKLQAAEAVIEQVENDEPDYFYDVLVEGDAYQIYITGEN